MSSEDGGVRSVGMPARARALAVDFTLAVDFALAAGRLACARFRALRTVRLRALAGAFVRFFEALGFGRARFAMGEILSSA